MKTRTLLTAAAVLALLFTGGAQAAPGISGRLTILQNEFILKLDEPFEHDDSEAQDGSFIVTATELHVHAGDQRAELRALVGKYVKFPYAGVRAAQSQGDCRPLVLEFNEGFYEVYPPGHEFAGSRVEAEGEASAPPAIK